LLILLSKIYVGAVLAAAVGSLVWRRMDMTPLGLLKLAVPLLLLVILAVAVISPGARYLLQAIEPFGFIWEHPAGALPNMAANLLLLCAAHQVWRHGTLLDMGCAELAAVIATASVGSHSLRQFPWWPTHP
jgi:hypothetical protein